MLYAWRTDRAPRNPDCPATGWVHEGRHPWRVIVSDELGEMDPPCVRSFTVAEYTGDEATVWYPEWLADGR